MTLILERSKNRAAESEKLLDITVILLKRDRFFWRVPCQGSIFSESSYLKTRMKQPLYTTPKKGMKGGTLTLESEVLNKLSRGGITYEELKRTFPGSNLSQVLISLEERKLVENRGGTWNITENGRREIEKGKKMTYTLSEKDALRKLKKGGTTYEELKRAFPDSNLSQVLILLEERKLVENRGGTWIITENGKREIEKRKEMAYTLLLVPAIVFFLLAAHFYSAYSQAYDTNTRLLQEKTETEGQLSKIEEQMKAVQAEYDVKLAELTGEQVKTSQLEASQKEATASLVPLKSELDYYDCLEKCTPDKFVTVDNPYVKAKAEEITAGLTTLREKQEAIFNFVRDHIEEDENIFRFGRIDLWEYPEEILKRGNGDYEDKYLLLLTMLRVVGTPPQDVRFVAAEVDGNDGWLWVECSDGQTSWILDPLEDYTFTSTPQDEFYKEHKVKILWWFNDTGFYLR